MKTQYQRHLLANRARRIPRRIKQIQAELLSIDTQIMRIEDDESVSAEFKATRIKHLRQSCAPQNYQLRCLVDRGHELGLQIAA
jgi:hypothetical protein